MGPATAPPSAINMRFVENSDQTPWKVSTKRGMAKATNAGCLGWHHLQEAVGSSFARRHQGFKTNPEKSPAYGQMSSLWGLTGDPDPHPPPHFEGSEGGQSRQAFAAPTLAALGPSELRPSELERISLLLGDTGLGWSGGNGCSGKPLWSWSCNQAKPFLAEPVEINKAKPPPRMELASGQLLAMRQRQLQFGPQQTLRSTRSLNPATSWLFELRLLLPSLVLTQNQ